METSALIEDIGKDTDKILNKMEGNNMDMNAFIAGQAMGNNRFSGYDAMAMNNQWNNPFMYLIWLAMFGGGNGFFGNGGNAQMNNALLQAVNNADATSQRDVDRLANSMGVAASNLQNGLNIINSSVQQVGAQVGLTAPQIINAVQNGNASITQAVANACCENRLAICQQTNDLTKNQAALGFLIQNESSQTRQLLTQQNYEAQIRELTKENNELRVNAQTQELINNNTMQTNAIEQVLAQMSNTISQIALASGATKSTS